MIYTEHTPNPDALKFIPTVPVTTGGTLDVRLHAHTLDIPLLDELFNIPEIIGVYLGPDFVTVTKDAGHWDDITPAILGVISENLRDPIDLSTGLDKDRSGQSDVINQIIELLDERVRPAVANDGGDIIFREYRDGIVYLELQGSCSGCPSSTATLRYGVENLIKHYIPEVIEVRSI